MAVDGGDVEVAPINTDAIACFGEDGLLDGAGTDVAHAFLVAHRGDGSLRILINGKQGRGTKENLNLMLAGVGSPYLIGDVVDGHGNEVVVIDEHGGGEDQVKFNGTANESVVGVRGKHINALLLGNFDVLAFGLDILEESEVSVCTASRVVAMCSNHVLACMEQILQVAIEMQHDAVHPRLACIGYFFAVDIKLEDIIVRILHIHILLQLLGGKFNLAADVDIAAGTSPAAVDVLALTAPGSLFCLP